MGFEMQEKTASTEVYEGLTVRHRHNADDLEFGDMRGYLGPTAVPAAAAYFQERRDEELGRWRWPENPDFVAWASRRSNEKDVTVLDESDGYVGYFTRADVEDERSGEGLIRRAARAYFEAHPERKPWHDAKPGEVWAVFVDGEEAFTVSVVQDVFGVSFRLPTGRAVDMNSTAHSGARRIWPEVA